MVCTHIVASGKSWLQASLDGVMVTRAVTLTDEQRALRETVVASENLAVPHEPATAWTSQTEPTLVYDLV